MKSKRTKATELRLPVREEKTESGNGGSAPRAGGAKGGGNGSSPVARPVTEVVARVDVGFGNTLFIRGQGNGLSWERGTRLACAGPATWVWSTPQARERVVFKLLLNDEIWAKGEDVVVGAGQRVEIVPGF